MIEPIHVVIESTPAISISLSDLLSSLLTPLIAIIAIYIAYSQYINDEKRLKFEQYEKRLNVYKSFQTFIDKVRQEGSSIDIVSIHKFHEEIVIAKYLFDTKCQKYLEEIFDKAIEMWDLNRKLLIRNENDELTISGGSRTKMCEEISIVEKYLAKQIGESIPLFKKYFQIL